MGVVRSSLDNLRLQPLPAEARVYIARADEGLKRLATILSRMSEATRLEPGLASTEREPFDLAAVVRSCAQQGAAFIGLNPLHALFPGNPWQFSPYSPSSRLFLNVLYIAVEQLPEFATCAEARAIVLAADFQAELARLREATARTLAPGAPDRAAT